MDRQDKIDIGTTSSLIDLKAEVLRKQRELQDTRLSTKGVPKSQKIPTNKIQKVKPNVGIAERIAKDEEIHAREQKTFERAKIMLEAKAKIYDQMQSEALRYDEHSHPVLANSLVNFQEKALEEHMKSRAPSSASTSNDELVEFIDTLGRTRKCRRSELAQAIAQDEQMAREQRVESEKRVNEAKDKLAAEVSEAAPNTTVIGSYAAVPPPTALNLTKTLTEEQVGEMKHQKWEEEAEKAAEKDHVHYQDVLYDELRSHGTGYFHFATEDQKRAEQIAELKKLSALTKTMRDKVAKEKSHKADKLKERLKKVRARKRARLGLPPKEQDSSGSAEEDKEEEKKAGQDGGRDSGDDDEEEIEKRKGIQGIDDIKNKLLRGEMRPWDFGKPGVYGPKPTNFDELDAKWLKDRREDRKGEFAPPSLYSRSSSSSGASKSGGTYNSVPPPSSENKYSNFVKAGPAASTSTGRGEWKSSGMAENRTGYGYQKPVPIQDECPRPVPDHVEAKLKRGAGVEVAPPATFDFYHGASTGVARAGGVSRGVDMQDSVMAGLKAARERVERMQKEGQQ